MKVQNLMHYHRRKVTIALDNWTDITLPYRQILNRRVDYGFKIVIDKSKVKCVNKQRGVYLHPGKHLSFSEAEHVTAEKVPDDKVSVASCP